MNRTRVALVAAVLFTTGGASSEYQVAQNLGGWFAPVPANAAAPAPPSGMATIRQAGTGRIFAIWIPGPPSATQLMQGFIGDLADYFDAPPQFEHTTHDKRDRRAQVAFAGLLHNMPVRGMLNIVAASNGGEGHMLIDYADQLPVSAKYLLAPKTSTNNGGGNPPPAASGGTTSGDTAANPPVAPVPGGSPNPVVALGNVSPGQPVSSAAGKIPGPSQTYWDAFPIAKAAGFGTPAFFPIATWPDSILSAADADAIKALGINTILNPFADSNLGLARAAGILTLVEGDTAHGWPAIKTYGSETVGWFYPDEADMIWGGGWDAWDGAGYWDSCTPKQSVQGACGFTVLTATAAKFPNDGRPKFLKIGKSAEFYLPDATAAKFMNGAANGTQVWPGSDLLALDPYAYSDENWCYSNHLGRLRTGTGPLDNLSDGLGLSAGHKLSEAECHRASNYGLVLDRVRRLDALDGKLQPIWVSVEAIAQQAALPITGPQIQGAVANALIHGAAGIIYFQYGPDPAGCVTFLSLRLASADPKCAAAVAAQPYVAALNAHIKALASVFNSPRLAWDFGVAGLDTALWQAPDGSVSIWVQQNAGATGTYALRLPPGLLPLGAPHVVDWQNGTDTVVPVAADGTLTVTFGHEWEWREIRFPAAGAVSG